MPTFRKFPCNICMMKIQKILIANRGEIAVRIIQTAQEMGIVTVSVFSEIDRLALHVMKADEVYALEDHGIEPYLDIDQILAIAHKAEVDAVHPGYGFLSENAAFARKVGSQGFVFIGPSPEAMELMGDKLMAKNLVQDADIPVIPGFEINPEAESELQRKAGDIGFPLLIKARAGGGGKGMRIVRTSDQLLEQVGLSVREAKEAFGDGRVFLEKFIQNPRHIEIQVLADMHGNVVHLFDRECSIQRRHQKVIEEAPSSALDNQTRDQMGQAAVRLVKSCNYTNAGTVEFMLDEQRNFYFLEMNTRLQVEHPVTEFITGIDLVKQQIRIAEGAPLPFNQEELRIKGHAVELRVYAEDPHNSFLPDIGILKKHTTPKGIGVRVDEGYTQGMEVPLEYDPLLAKLVVHAANREAAIARMKRSIGEYEIDGVKNTLEFGGWVMDDQDFQAGDFDTDFISKKLGQFIAKQADTIGSMIAGIVGADIIQKNKKTKTENKPILHSKWRDRLK